MNERLIRRLEKIEQPIAENQTVVVVIDESISPRSITINGKSLSEQEYELFKKHLPCNTQLHEVAIVENKPSASNTTAKQSTEKTSS